MGATETRKATRMWKACAMLLCLWPLPACSSPADLGGESAGLVAAGTATKVAAQAESLTTAESPSGVLLEDDFSDPGSGWQIGEFNQGRVGYGEGFYFVTSVVGGSQNWGVADQFFGDLVIDADASQALGPANDNNAYGLMCRVQPNGDGYTLRISGDGYYSIHKLDGGSFQTLVDWTASEAVRQGNATNHLRAVCDGSALALFVNGELVAEASDDTFQGGDIAFTATTFEEQSTEVHFDNLVARPPEPR